jgi:hypothetical protein
MRIHILMGIVGIGLFAISEPALAATINISSIGDGTASRANAQAAYDAASPGDTIIFPLNGSATWSTPLSIGKALTLNGNGTTLTAAAAGSDGIFYVTGFTSDALMRITGFTFNLVNFNVREGAVRVLNNISLGNLRIDHNTFHYGYTQIEVGGSKGVIDHNYFYNPLKGISFTAGSATQATQSWLSMAAGTGDALFIEDNSFIYDANYPGTFSQESIGTYNGGKLVIRYNNWDSSVYPLTLTIDPIMTHGSAAAGVANGYWQIGTGARRGQSVVEIYNNIMVGKRIDFMAILRGSANLVFNNSLTNTITATPRIYLREEEYGGGQWSPARTAWPAEDQVHNTFIWANTFNGVAQTTANADTGDVAGILQENRDYFLHAPQATGGREIFTGANGASSSFPTDGSTHPTQGTMVFIPTGPNAYYGYTPYTYPHPLTVTPAQAPTTASVKIFIP